MTMTTKILIIRNKILNIGKSNKSYKSKNKSKLQYHL